jgi:phosphatidylserine/phosphatidylglycerophosphate/cardiolipin synthase-like enzyme
VIAEIAPVLVPRGQLLRSIRAARPDGAPTYVIMDNLAAHKGEQVRRWARKNRVELRFTPTYASWADLRPGEPYRSRH